MFHLGHLVTFTFHLHDYTQHRPGQVVTDLFLIKLYFNLNVCFIVDTEAAYIPSILVYTIFELKDRVSHSHRDEDDDDTTSIILVNQGWR